MEEVYCGLRFKRIQSTLIGRHGDGGLAAVAVEASPHLGRSGSRVGRKHPQDQAVNLRTYTHSHQFLQGGSTSDGSTASNCSTWRNT